MINKIKLKNKYIAVCDICDNETGVFDTFQDAIEHMKNEGWKAHKTNDGWEHICPECKACE